MLQMKYAVHAPAYNNAIGYFFKGKLVDRILRPAHGQFAAAQLQIECRANSRAPRTDTVLEVRDKRCLPLSRRQVFSILPMITGLGISETSFAFGKKPGPSKELTDAFTEAMEAMNQFDFDAAEEAWTRAVQLSPEVSASWSNRGTLKLQRGRWAEAAEDLQHALDLEEKQMGRSNVNSLVLNNLGNCKGALGDWDGAMSDYLEAAKDPAMEEVARANYALALFQVTIPKLVQNEVHIQIPKSPIIPLLVGGPSHTGDAARALKEAQQLLRKDPQFWDMRAASTAFLWAMGDEAGAEAEFEKLKGMGSGLGAAMYSSTDRVKARWPPRCTAALEAYFHLEREAEARDYNGEMRLFTFV
mmetsp:Transcript_24796/g.47008  ORF Transcript_24796/g.47008 Transcript_24796/m.47008 type:complete len:358 (+) Transcript_24796:62-1135(+)